MKLPTGSPARRLAVASTSAMVFHAAVFGVIEWNLSRTESRPARDSTPISVAVTMQSAAQPADEPETPPQEVLDTSSKSVEVDDVAEPSDSRGDEVPNVLATVVDEILAESTTLRDSEFAETAAAAPEPDADSERTGATTPAPAPSNEDESVAAALQQSVGPRRNTEPIASPPTLEPERYTPPRYPETARRQGLTGTVVVEATIGRRGRVASVRVLDSSGVDSLDRAATRAIATWRFTRGTENQISIHRIRFDLEEHR